MKINKDGGDVFQIFNLDWDDVQRIIEELDKVSSTDGVVFYPEMIEKFWNMFQEEEKKAFSVFSLGRLVGILEVVYRTAGVERVIKNILDKEGSTEGGGMLLQ